MARKGEQVGYKRALEIIMQAHREGLSAAAGRAQRVGRNAPCPCGSGKKHKQCCADRPTTQVSTTSPEELGARLMPRLEDVSALSADLHHFNALLHADPGLRTLRFDAASVLGFLARSEHAAAWRAPDAAPSDREAIAAAYLREHLPLGFLGRLDTALTDAVGRHLDDVDALRVLITALFLVEASLDESTSAGFSESPIGVSLFYASVTEAQEQVLSRIGVALNAGLAHGAQGRIDPGALEGVIVESLASLAGDAASVSLLRGLFGAMMARLDAALRDDSFPVGFPRVSSLPLIVAMLQAGAERESLTPEQMVGLVERNVDAVLLEEDAALYEHFLSAWLANHERDAPGYPLVVLMLGTLANEGLERFARLLALTSLRGTPSMLDAELDLPLREPDGRVSSAALRRIADLYDEAGYPAIAARTRGLVDALE